MKQCRFIKEYANYKKQCFEDLKKSIPENTNVWNEKNEKINKILKLNEKGLMTIDETIKSLSEI